MRNWKAILGVLAVFLLGVIAGGLATHGFYQKRIRAHWRGQAAATPEVIARQMGGDLTLCGTGSGACFDLRTAGSSKR